MDTKCQHFFLFNNYGIIERPRFLEAVFRPRILKHTKRGLVFFWLREGRLMNRKLEMHKLFITNHTAAPIGVEGID